jgi:phosphoglycerate dehydrogenase-like enzyme
MSAVDAAPVTVAIVGAGNLGGAVAAGLLAPARSTGRTCAA